jgi:hypothetical protein
VSLPPMSPDQEAYLRSRLPPARGPSCGPHALRHAALATSRAGSRARSSACRSGRDAARGPSSVPACPTGWDNSTAQRALVARRWPGWSHGPLLGPIRRDDRTDGASSRPPDASDRPSSPAEGRSTACPGRSVPSGGTPRLIGPSLGRVETVSWLETATLRVRHRRLRDPRAFGVVATRGRGGRIAARATGRDRERAS